MISCPCSMEALGEPNRKGEDKRCLTVCGKCQNGGFSTEQLQTDQRQVQHTGKVAQGPGYRPGPRRKPRGYSLAGCQRFVSSFSAVQAQGERKPKTSTMISMALAFKWAGQKCSEGTQKVGDGTTKASLGRGTSASTAGG